MFSVRPVFDPNFSALFCVSTGIYLGGSSLDPFGPNQKLSNDHEVLIVLCVVGKYDKS